MELTKPTIKKFSDEDIRVMLGFNPNYLITKSYQLERSFCQSLITKFKLSIKLRYHKLKQDKDLETLKNFEFIEDEFNKMEHTIIEQQKEIVQLKVEIKMLNEKK